MRYQMSFTIQQLGGKLHGVGTPPMSLNFTYEECMKRYLYGMAVLVCAIAVAIVLGSPHLHAQGVTTGSVSGVVTGPGQSPVAGATVSALHQPSGTTYRAVTRADGRFSIPGMRVGGPYRVTVSPVGFDAQVRENVVVNLGVTTDIEFSVRQVAVEVEGITVTGQRSSILSSERTGAATSVSREAITTLPTISGRLESITRLTPQAGSGMSFAGQDNRLNNITVDGSYFNNSFGLGGQPGDRTGVAPISFAAIEQVQVNIAPFDVRQGNFVGASVNTVTRSGTNDLRGSVYHQFRNENLVGTQAGANTYDPGTFNFRNTGGWLSGPIVKNRLFFFVNYENDALTEPGTTFLANAGGQTPAGNITRVRASSLDSLSSFLGSRFNYETGSYQGYSHQTPATRFLGKLDFNVNDRNKLSLRYNHLDSNTDVLASNSSSLGFGRRRTSTQALNFRNTNYQILENIRSVVGEWNSIIGGNMANNLILGYTYQDESRASRGTFFPLVDILEAGSTYTSFGFEPFTPNNELRYGTFQFQNNFSIYGENHSFTFGLSAERFESENVFFPGSQSAYTYNSLADFYADANDYLAKCSDLTSQVCLNRTSPVTLRRFQVRYANIPGLEKPVQPLEVLFGGIYGQDEWQAHNNLKLTLGLRLDVPFFAETGFENAAVDAMSFRDENGNPVSYSTSKLPDANLLISPRLGFNLDVFGNRSTQVRGGSGVFTGRPAYVWISNQIGENGILTGFEELNNTRARPFNPDPNRYKPTTVTGAPASSYALAFSDPDFKFPQLWRNNIAIDQRLPFGLVGTAEFLYDRDVNGVYYINANLREPNAQFTGPDGRPRWTGSNRINSNITSAVVLKNQNEGRAWNMAGSLERPFANGLFLKAAYSYGEARNTVDPGSIAFGSWNNNPHAGDPNNPGLGYAGASAGHRAFVTGSYRAEYFRFGATTVSLFAEGRTLGNTSYTFSGDLNGDGGFSNDLIYIHRDVSEMNFQPYTQGEVRQGGVVTVPARTFTAAEQAAAWNAFIEQDKYLRANRGEYAERGAVFLPMVYRADLSLAQELFTNIAGKRNGIQFRTDILNLGNLLNSGWGVGQRLVEIQPLIVPSSSQGGPADAQGRAQYRLRSSTVDGQHQLLNSSFEPTASIGDVYRIQFSLRYTFN